MKKFLFLIATALFTLPLFAQENKSDLPNIPHVDVIYLKNGSQLRGRILGYIQDESFDFELIGTYPVKMRIKEKDIKKIVQERTDVATALTKTRKEYAFKEKGWYNASYISTLSGISPRQSWSLGAGIHHVFGYQFNRYAGAGLGAGVDLYNTDVIEAIVPIFAEFRGYFLARNITPYYSLSTGYGISIQDDATQVKETNGGFMVHPCIGYRIGGSKGANFLMDFGVKLQQAKYVRGNVSDWNGEVTEERLFKRFTVRLGLVF